MTVFLSGPYHSSEPGGKEGNIWNARRVSIELWKRGIPNICPHLNSQDFEFEIPLDAPFVMGYLEILRKCDAVIMLPNWQQSLNSVMERKEALQSEIDVYDSLEEFLEKVRGEK